MGEDATPDLLHAALYEGTAIEVVGSLDDSTMSAIDHAIAVSLGLDR